MAIKLGFIGFGIMGERLARAALAHEQTTIAGIYDPHPATVGRVAAIAPQLRVFFDVDQLISASDALHIASPPASHLEHLMRCHTAGKVALCEKPLAVDVLAAQACVKDLVLGHARAAVNFPFVSSPAVDHLVDWITHRDVGDPVRIDIDLAYAAWPRSWQRNAADWLDAPHEGGFTREVASHFLFLSRRFFGPLKLLAGDAQFPEAGKSERVVRADLLAGDIPIRLSGRVGGTDQDDHNSWTLTGTKGRMRLRNWVHAEEEEEDGSWKPAPGGMSIDKARALTMVRQLEKIAAMTRGEATNLATLEDALDVQIAVETIVRG